MDPSAGNYYTVRGYRKRQSGEDHLTEAMEDYLEMLCRCSQPGEPVRVLVLAWRLHVKPSSASKMISHLRRLELVDAEPYGAVVVTPKGRALGEYLLHRHEVLLRFFALLGGEDDPLEEVELIEHYLTPHTIGRLELLVLQLENNPQKEPED